MEFWGGGRIKIFSTLLVVVVLYDCIRLSKPIILNILKGGILLNINYTLILKNVCSKYNNCYR